MTFYNTDIQYRVTLDTKLNLFIVFDKKDANHFATGITIEQAVQELKKTASGVYPNEGYRFVLKAPR